MEREESRPKALAEGDQLDLATVGLAVFFVSLIVIVGLLLLLPAIF